MSFVDICEERARSFIQTAIVIDDQAALEIARNAPPVGAAKQVSGSILKRVKQNTEDTAPEMPAVVEEPRPTGSLNAKALCDAFLARDIMCALYKPTPSENMVELSFKAAKTADVVILDWYLDGHTSAKAKAIVLEILKSDSYMDGRLRLIAVYTSEPDLTDLASELLASIQGVPVLANSFSIIDDPKIIQSTDTRICFVNKPIYFDSSDSQISEEQLPGHLIRQFSRLTVGVLSNFCLDAIAALRRATHHIISVLSRELDGVFLAHRCSIDEPDDANEFALELLLAELRKVITNQGIPERNLHVEILCHWIKYLSSSGHIFKNQKGAKVPEDLLIRFIKEGNSAVKNSASSQILGQGIKPVSFHDLSEIFYSDGVEAVKRNQDLAKLIAFKRDQVSSRTYPKEWRPFLISGTVLQLARRSKDKKKDYVGLPEFLVCIQPQCDCVRISKKTGFTFQSAAREEKVFNLVVSTGASDVRLSVSEHPRGTVKIDFKPEPEGRRVIAARKYREDFYFEDVLGRRFRWLGELKDLRAQKLCNEVAANSQRVGLDEYEWLRLAGENKLKL